MSTTDVLNTGSQWNTVPEVQNSIPKQLCRNKTVGIKLNLYLIHQTKNFPELKHVTPFDVSLIVERKVIRRSLLRCL